MLKKLTGIVLAALALFSVYVIWASNVWIASFVGLTAISTVIELFKDRKLQGYDYFAMAVVVSAGIFAELSLTGALISPL